MPIQSGTHLGPYQITGAIGAGGMGEVYRARDPKLGRDVAIKVLPEAFAGDTARMARFQREAKVLASLSHPNIATIYGLEDSGSTRALVMELVEGLTLADRIKQGPLPYLSPDRKVMAVEVATLPAFRAGVPKALFQAPPQALQGLLGQWDVTSDGARFLFSTLGTETVQAPFTVVLNWPSLLKK